jgi:hypothetical protein
MHWRDCLIDITIAPDSWALSLLTAGRSGDDYTSRLHALSFPDLFDKHDLGSYIEQLRDEWAADFQFVLVDSRTGVTDIGGICTVHLADVLVLLFTTTESSTEGAMQVLQRARRERERLPRDREQLLAVPLPARDESRTEYERATEWKNRFAEQFGDLYRDWLPSGIAPLDAVEKLRIPYVPYWSFGEQLPAVEEGTTDPASLGYSYQILARILATRLDWYKALEGQEVAPPPTAKIRQLDSDWLTRHSQAAIERLLSSGLPGFMEVFHFCMDSFPQKSQPELLVVAKQAQAPRSGWPIGLVLDNPEERPRPTNDGILAIVTREASLAPGRRFDYWSLNKRGDFYTLRSLSEDNLDEDRVHKAIYSGFRIVQATEALVHCANLYKAFGVDPNARIELRVRYGGLRERTLREGPYHPQGPTRKNLHEGEVSVPPMTFRLGAVEGEIVDLVKKLCAPLFIIFDFAEFGDEIYQQIVTDFLKGKASIQKT